MSVNVGHVFVFIVYCFCFIGYAKVVASLQCYSCPSKNTAEGCQRISSCGPDQVCMLRRTVNNNTQEILYESRCEDKVACDLELDRYRAILSALVGRKREMKQVLAGDVCLIQCCDQDLCNNGCVMPTNRPVNAAATSDTSTQPTIETVTSNTQPIINAISTNTQPTIMSVITSTQPTIETVTKSTQPTIETVTTSTQPTTETVTSNTQPIIKTVSSNMQPTIKPVTTSTHSTIETVTTNTRPITETVTSNTQPMMKTVTTNKNPTLKIVTSNTQQTIETVTTNNQPTIQAVTSNTQPTIETFTTNKQQIIETVTANTQPTLQKVTTNKKTTTETVTTNTQSTTATAYTQPATESATTNKQLFTTTLTTITQQPLQTKTTHARPSLTNLTTNMKPTLTVSFGIDTQTTQGNSTTRKPGAILVPTKPSMVTTTFTGTYQNSRSTESFAFTMKPTNIPEPTKVTTDSSSSSDCPYGSVTFDTSCYFFAKQEMSYRDAKMFCAKYNSHLVHVDSSRENEFLKNQFTKMHSGPTQFWIGITDEQTEKVWRFYDSETEATFFDWSPGEPDGTQLFDGNANADCAVFDPYLKFQWRDEDCSPYQYSKPVCEISK